MTYLHHGGLRVGVVGAGRVGSVLAARLRSAGHDVVAVSGESDASRARIEALLPGLEPRRPSAVARLGDVLLLTVPDDMLPNVVRVLADSGALRAGQVVVHTSGRHGLAVLDPAVAVGARPLALHPVMTFTGTGLDLERLAGCAVGLTAAEAERDVAERLVADLGGRPTWVAEEMRSLYHAGLAHGSNHLVTVISEAREMLAAAGCEDPAAILRPLATAALDNALVQGDAALTGPIVRGDLGTVRAHLDDLLASAPQTLDSYVALARATLERAVGDGRLVPRRAQMISTALDAALAAAPGARAASDDVVNGHRG